MLLKLLIALSKGIQDSLTLWILRRGFRILEPMILDSKSENFPRSRIRIPLHEVILTQLSDYFNKKNLKGM